MRALLALLLLPLAGTLIYSIASSWSATILPSGFTLKWYIALWSDPRFLHAFGQSLVVCVGALVLSVVVRVMGVLGRKATEAGEGAGSAAAARQEGHQRRRAVAVSMKPPRASTVRIAPARTRLRIEAL